MEPNLQPIGKYLIFLGIIFIILGVIFYFFKGIPFFGKLPGDIFIEKKNFSFYFPIVTCILLSVIISIILYFFRK